MTSAACFALATGAIWAFVHWHALNPLDGIILTVLVWALFAIAARTR